jgi:hypothetical protein
MMHRTHPASRAGSHTESRPGKPGAAGGPISQHTPVAGETKRAPQPGTDALRRASGRK